MSQMHGGTGGSPGELDPELQRELDEALGGHSVEELMEQSAAQAAAADAAAHNPAAGEGEGQGDAGPDPASIHHEIRRGRIAAIRGEDVFVDLAGEAGKLQGVVPLAQFERSPRLGSIMDFVVERIDEGQGLVYLSREGAVSRATWDQLQRGAVVEARVVSTNKGGLELEMVGGIRAFMPASQIDLHHVGELEPLIGQKLEASVQEVDRKAKKVLLNRRHLLQQRRAEAKRKLMAELEVDQVREGAVSSLVEFGAFVDLGGVDGLIHVSDLSYTHIDRPADAVRVGQTVRVKVLKIDREKDRISLGLKQVEPDPWDGIGERLSVGEQVAGRVLRTTNFGAFVEVEPGVEGLAPMSELSWSRIGKAEQVVQVGQVIHVKIINLDPARRRMSLSLKQAQGDPWVGAERKFEKGGQVEGKVISTTDFGAFVELEPGVEGMVHISELSDRRVGAVTDVVNVGDVKTFRVLEADEKHRRIRLSLKSEAAAGESPAVRGKPGAAKPQAASPRKPRKDLKSGLGDAGGLGIGLGGLRLEDLK